MGANRDATRKFNQDAAAAIVSIRERLQKMRFKVALKGIRSHSKPRTEHEKELLKCMQMRGTEAKNNDLSQLLIITTPSLNIEEIQI